MKLIQLLVTVFLGTLFPLPTIASTRVNEANKATETLEPITPRSDISQGAQYQSKLEIASGELRLMTEELEGLIGRFQMTLLTADANHTRVDLSSSEVVEKILKQETIGNKGDNKSLQVAKSQYQNSHRALQLAVRKLARFQYLATQKKFAEAQLEWTAAKQALWDNYPRSRPVAESEVRGMWLDRGTIVKAKSEADLAQVFDRMAMAGINTVFFETLNSSYTIYPSTVAPQQNPLVKGWDPLQAAVKLAHERDMELHAWVWTFAAVNQRHNTILGLPRTHLGPVLSRHQDWAMTDQQGSRFHYSSGKVFLDPANPQVKDYLDSLITEIATEYDVDGIHLDYIRYPFESLNGKVTYGYGAAARQKFHNLTGFDPIDLDPAHPLWSRWTEFRVEQIDNFVESVSQNLKRLRPELILSTAVFPMPQQERLSK
ncbi:MAG: family 10 glycosylhydrolase, partial [Cyanobacteria bacterium P01_A01_bin.83]